ncbi:hypothetical protein [Pontixanthobacter luteolus]|uniref:hypothetical protein n=1 Tax=Pontixanthobacter luteolus TaxID=295089 RepID=UPI002302557D|nr:hypothetical protein [Pontixanthobacter luteolus]
MSFDPDALLAAMPKREIRPIPEGVRILKTRPRAVPTESAMGQPQEYNGFTKRERYRIADLSVWLAKVGATDRPRTCDICGGEARDEHAENYYDLSGWIGLCIPCHRNALHKRFDKQSKWFDLLDRHQLNDNHWARLLSMQPFDIAALMRDRGIVEPCREDFA